MHGKCLACTYLEMKYRHALPWKMLSSHLHRNFNNSRFLFLTRIAGVTVISHYTDTEYDQPLFNRSPSPHDGCSCPRLHAVLPRTRIPLIKRKHSCEDLEPTACGAAERTTVAALLLLGWSARHCSPCSVSITRAAIRSSDRLRWQTVAGKEKEKTAVAFLHTASQQEMICSRIRLKQSWLSICYPSELPLTKEAIHALTATWGKREKTSNDASLYYDGNCGLVNDPTV